jgi:hypothetical protein
MAQGHLKRACGRLLGRVRLMLYVRNPVTNAGLAPRKGVVLEPVTQAR